MTWRRRRALYALSMGGLFAFTPAVGRQSHDATDVLVGAAFALLLALAWYGSQSLMASSPLPPLTGAQKAAIYEAAATGVPPMDAGLTPYALRHARRFASARGVVLMASVMTLVVTALVVLDVIPRSGPLTPPKAAYLACLAVIVGATTVAGLRQARASARLRAAPRGCGNGAGPGRRRLTCRFVAQQLDVRPRLSSCPDPGPGGGSGDPPRKGTP